MPELVLTSSMTWIVKTLENLRAREKWKGERESYKQSNNFFPNINDLNQLINSNFNEVSTNVMLCTCTSLRVVATLYCLFEGFHNSGKSLV